MVTKFYVKPVCCIRINVSFNFKCMMGRKKPNPVNIMQITLLKRKHSCSHRQPSEKTDACVSGFLGARMFLSRRALCPNVQKIREVFYEINKSACFPHQEHSDAAQLFPHSRKRKCWATSFWRQAEHHGVPFILKLPVTNSQITCQVFYSETPSSGGSAPVFSSEILTILFLW